MKGHSLCGWVEKPELSSLFGSCILSSIPGIYHWYQSTLLLPCGVGTAVVLSLEAKDGTGAEAGSPSWSYGRWILIFTKTHGSGTKCLSNSILSIFCEGSMCISLMHEAL